MCFTPAHFLCKRLWAFPCSVGRRRPFLSVMYPSFKRERQICRVKFSGHFMWTERVERAFSRDSSLVPAWKRRCWRSVSRPKANRCFSLTESRQDTCGGSENQETMKNTPRTAAIMPARDESETIAPMMPSTAPAVPRRQLSKRRPESVLVHRAAVMAGMIINAMTRIEPMDWKDVTATRRRGSSGRSG